MSTKIKYIVFYIFLFLMFIGSAIINVSANNSIEEREIIVLFDEAHKQFFNRSYYRTAISDINSSDVHVIFNSQRINKTTFDGVDIFVSTNPGLSFTSTERYYISEFLKRGKSLLFLSNPLVEENSTLNGRGDLFNDVLSDPELETVSRFWTRTEDLTSFKRPDVVENEFVNAGKRNFLVISINSSDHEILYENNNNISSIITYTCSLRNSRENIIRAPSQAYAKTVFDEIHSYASNIVIFGTSGESDYGAHILLGGSSIMFSDLNDTSLEKTWYQSADNSLLWKNIFSWLAEVTVEAELPLVSTEQVILAIAVLFGAAILLTAFGSIFYTIGSGRKTKIIKVEQVLSKTPIIEEKESPELTGAEKVSKRKRRFQQMQRKSPRGKK
ncbi:hypothetical protein [Candidatus Hodarchaeum mangrovi]